MLTFPLLPTQYLKATSKHTAEHVYQVLDHKCCTASRELDNRVITSSKAVLPLCNQILEKKQKKRQVFETSMPESYMVSILKYKTFQITYISNMTFPFWFCLRVIYLHLTRSLQLIGPRNPRLWGKNKICIQTCKWNSKYSQTFIKQRL